MSRKVPRHRRRYPKAFTKYWRNVEICGIEREDDFKHEAYLAWKAGTQNGSIRTKRRINLLYDPRRW